MARKKRKHRKVARRSKVRRLTRKKRAWISRKIRFLIKREGYLQKQAIAIAYRMAGVARKRRKARR